MLGRQNSLVERMIEPAPQVYVSAAAEDMIPRQVLHMARSPKDAFDRAEMLMQLPGKISGLSMVRINGLCVIGPAREDNHNGIGKSSALRQMQSQYGMQKDVAAALYTTFGDAAVEMAGEVRNYMIMPTPNGSRMEQGLLKDRQIRTIEKLDGLAKMHGITMGGEGLELLMTTSGTSFYQLRDMLENSKGTRYIANTYGVDLQTASLAREMADSSEGIKSFEDLESHDLSMYVDAASASVGKGGAFGLRNNNWFPISGRSGIRRDSPSRCEAAEAAQMMGVSHKTSSDHVGKGIGYIYGGTNGGKELKDAFDGCAFDVDAALQQ